MAHAKNTRLIGAWPLLLLLTLWSCAAAPSTKLALSQIGANPLWLPEARNNTTGDLRLPSGNPLRSLAEMSGKTSPEYRSTVMSSLREELKQELEQRKVSVRLPEQHDRRLSALPLAAEPAARIARESGLAGFLLLSEIRRWDADASGLVRIWVELKLVRIADGGLLWERRVQKALAAPRTANAGAVHQDAVAEVMRELF
jgi:hypothetical protein